MEIALVEAPKRGQVRGVRFAGVEHLPTPSVDFLQAGNRRDLTEHFTEAKGGGLAGSQRFGGDHAGNVEALHDRLAGLAGLLLSQVRQRGTRQLGV